MQMQTVSISMLIYEFKRKSKPRREKKKKQKTMKSLLLIWNIWMTQIMIDSMDEFRSDEYIFVDKVFLFNQVFVVLRVWCSLRLVEILMTKGQEISWTSV